MGRSGQATEWTSQQILDMVNKSEPLTTDKINSRILEELEKINIQLSIITGDKI